jgi:four helix bundle protein
VGTASGPIPATLERLVAGQVPVQHFTRLEVWKKAHRLSLEIYRATQGFPRAELYGLTGQLRRAVASIGANIAEGRGRMGDGDFGRFIRYALGSASELECHLLLARDLSLRSAECCDELEGKTREVQRMLASLARKLERRKGETNG